MNSTAKDWEVPVPCRDSAGRERNALVFFTDDLDIAVKAPPGEVAVWHRADIPRLQEVLHRFAVEATDRMGGAR